VGYYTYDKLTDIRRFSRFFQYKCRNGTRNFIFIKLKVRNVLPYWAYRFGGGPVPDWTWYGVLTLALLSPFWALGWTGLQLNWGYVYSFVGGFVLGEIISERRRELFCRQLVDYVEKEHHVIENFCKANRQGE